MKTVLLLLTIGLINLNVFSQTINTEAPSVSASGVTVPEGAFQIEATFVQRKINTYFLDSYQYGLPSILMRYGLTDRVELRGTLSPQFTHYNDWDTKGTYFDIANIGVGAKYRLTEDISKPTQMSVIAHLKVLDILDAFSDPKSSRVSGFYGTFAISHAFDDRHSIGGNFGLGSQYFKPNSNNYAVSSEVMVSVIYNYSLTHKFTLFGELFSNRARWKNYNNGNSIFNDSYKTWGIDVGVLYLLRDKIQLDYAFGIIFLDPAFFQSIGFNILF